MGCHFCLHRLRGMSLTTALTLTAVQLPVVQPGVFMASVNPPPLGLRAGQTLIVDATLARDYNAAPGSTVEVRSDGIVGDNFEAVGATVNVMGGSAGNNFDAGASAVVNIVGGSTGISFDAYAGSTINVVNGTVGPLFRARAGSVVNLRGGVVGDSFEAFSASAVNISGGVFENEFHSDAGSTVVIQGRDFRLDGVPIAGLDGIGNTLPVNIPAGSQLTGTLSDGTPFAFSNQDSEISNGGDAFANGTLTLQAVAIPAIGPAEITRPPDAAVTFLRHDQTLTLLAGATVGDNFNAGWGSRVNVSGGAIGRNFEAAGAEVNVSAGSISSGFDAYTGSVVNISGGTVCNLFDAFGGSVVNISGGSLGDNATAFGGSVVNITGGSIGTGFHAEQSEVHVSGGTFAGAFTADEGSEVQISGGSVGGFFKPKVTAASVFQAALSATSLER